MPSTTPAPDTIETCCCIAGGGPAGMMLGYLLVRAGIQVVVLEKHADFLRDFRGDTIHPSTLEVMHELGVLDAFLERPHQELSRIAVQIGEEWVTVADFSHLPTHCKFIAFMPQWDFLNFIAEEARRYPGFRLEMEAEAFVLWMRLSQKPGDPAQALGRVNSGRLLIMLDRGDYWQCAFVIRKGGLDEIRQRGLPSFRDDIVAIAPFLRDRVDELKDWDQIKLLSVAVDRLKQWYRPGLLCIGDAAHAMSPVGGVGINLAIQDAVAAANILTSPLLHKAASVDVLRKVQRRRMFPTRATQRMQVLAQNRVIRPILKTAAPIRSLPWPAKLLQRWPLLRRIPARVIGVGFRPEHVRR